MTGPRPDEPPQLLPADRDATQADDHIGDRIVFRGLAHDEEPVLRELRADEPATPLMTPPPPHGYAVRCGLFGPAAREIGAGSAVETEQRREQLNRWHDDDRSALEASEIERGDADTGHESAAGDGGPGRDR